MPLFFIDLYCINDTYLEYLKLNSRIKTNTGIIKKAGIIGFSLGIHNNYNNTTPFV